MLGAIMTSAFSTVCFTMVMLLRIVFREKLHMQKRIKEYVYIDEKSENILEGSFADRVIKPVMEKGNRFLGRIAPKHYYNYLERMIKEAGNPKGITVGGVVLLQIFSILVSAGAAVIMLISMDIPLLKMLVLVCILLVLINIIPKFYLRHRISARQKEIERGLPDVLDLLTVSIEAGLSFDGAVAKLVEKMSGVLAEEFSIVLKEMKVGVSKKEAFKSLVERVPVPSLVTFVSSIIQADQLGVSIGNVLRIQSAQVRQKRMERTKENAMKAPVKMLLPMIIFIMPTIFIVILGPVVIKIIEAFG